MRWQGGWQYRRYVVSGRSTVLSIARAVRPARPDVFITLALTLVVLGITDVIAHWHTGHVIDPRGTLWLAACTAPLLWRCRASLIVLVLTSVATFTYYASGYPGGPAILAPTLALVTVAYVRGPVVGGVAGGVLAAAEIAKVLAAGDHNGTFDPRLIGLVLWVAVAVCIGTFGRMRRAAFASAAQRAAEADRLRAEEQRLRIAREVHDVVAHSLAMINVQAGVAAHVADRRPERGQGRAAGDQGSQPVRADRPAGHARRAALRRGQGADARAGPAARPGHGRVGGRAHGARRRGRGRRAAGAGGRGRLPDPAGVA